jgi:SPP1 gp7 family putative phage head morphogenesis protein
MVKRLVAPDGKPVQVRAVHANLGVQRWYRDQLQDLMFRMNRSLILHIEAAWKQNPPSPGFAHDAPTSTILLQRAMKKWGGLWQKKFDRLSLDLSRKFAKKTFSTTENAMREAFKAAGFTVSFKPTPTSVESYHAVVAENVGLIKSIPQQYLRDVQSSVWSSVMKGADMGELSKTIQEKYGVSYRRAALIARDQNNKAKATIENKRRQELGITQAKWRHSTGGKVPRPSHIGPKMNGQLYDLKKGMYDPDEGQFVYPGQLINCRCTSMPIIKGIDDIAPEKPAKRKYAYEVLYNGSSAGDRSTREGAEQLVARLVSFSKGKLTSAAFEIREK